MFTHQRIYLSYPPSLFPVHCVIILVFRVESKSFYTKFDTLLFYGMNGGSFEFLYVHFSLLERQNVTVIRSKYSARRKSRYCVLILCNTDCQLEKGVVFLKFFILSFTGRCFSTEASFLYENEKLSLREGC